MSNINSYRINDIKMSTPIENKPKIDRSKYIIEKQNDTTIYKHFGEVDGFNFKIRRNTNTTIYILDHCSGMFVDDCENCKIITGPINGSIFIRTSKNCTISTIARQVRFRDCENLKVFTYCPTDPAVESSFNIFFAPYNVFFPHLKELFITAKFDKAEPNHIKTPHDFTVDKVMGDGAPHFGLLDKEQIVIEEVKDGDAEVEEMYEGYSQEEEDIREKRGLPVLNNAIKAEPSQPMNNQGGFDFISDVPLGMETSTNQQSSVPIDDFFTSQPINNNPSTTVQSNPIESQVFNSIPIDEEEEKRIVAREAEAEERARKIREKQELEIKLKNELREKAVAYMNTFNEARMKKISDNKTTNTFNEQQALKDKKELTELGGKRNPWERVIENISMKPSEYKGTKDVSRMREVIIGRKNDLNNK